MASSDAQPLPRYEPPPFIESSGAVPGDPSAELELFVPTEPITIRKAKVRVIARTKATPHPIISDFQG